MPKRNVSLHLSNHYFPNRIFESFWCGVPFNICSWEKKNPTPKATNQSNQKPQNKPKTKPHIPPKPNQTNQQANHKTNNQSSYLENLGWLLLSSERLSLSGWCCIAEPLAGAPVCGQLQLTWTVLLSLPPCLWGMLSHTEEAAWCTSEGWVILSNLHDNQT